MAAPGLRARMLRVAASNLLRELNTVTESEMSPEQRQRIKAAMDSVAVCADRLDGVPPSEYHRTA